MPHPGQRRLSTQLRGGGPVPASSCVRPPSSGPTQLYAPRSKAPGARLQGHGRCACTSGDTGPLPPRTLAVCGTGPGTGGGLCQRRGPLQTQAPRCSGQTAARALPGLLSLPHCLSFRGPTLYLTLKRSYPTLKPTRSLLTFSGCSSPPRLRPVAPKALGTSEQGLAACHLRRWPCWG